MSRRIWISGLGIIILGAAFLAAQLKFRAMYRWDYLHRKLQGADRLVVVVARSSTVDDAALVGSPIFELKGQRAVEELVKQIEWLPPDTGIFGSSRRCMCDGDYHFEFYRDDLRLASIGYHHGKTIRWRDGPWTTDIELTSRSRRALPKWFSERGFDGLTKIVIQE